MADTPRNKFSTIAGSSCGISLVTVTQIAIIECPSKLLLVAVCFFAVAIPGLATAYLVAPIRDDITPDQRTPEEIEAFQWFVIVMLIDVIGFALLFIHLGKVAGVLFVMSVIWSLQLLVRQFGGPGATLLGRALVSLVNYYNSLRRMLRGLWRR